MDPLELREMERLLATEYGVEHTPNSPDSDDLESDDVEDAEHWVQVFTELMEFGHTMRETASEAPLDQRCALALQAKLHELHLAYWASRLDRARATRHSKGHQPL